MRSVVGEHCCHFAARWLANPARLVPPPTRYWEQERTLDALRLGLFVQEVDGGDGARRPEDLEENALWVVAGVLQGVRTGA